MDIYKYWEVTLKQDRGEMKDFFQTEAKIRFHNTEEEFTVNEFIEVNYDYPGNWGGNIERISTVEDTIISVVQVFDLEKHLSFHVTSFMEIKNDKIQSIDEYWGEDGSPPLWRLEKKIGKKFNKSKK